MVIGRKPSYPNWQRKRIQNPSSVSSSLTEGTTNSRKPQFLLSYHASPGATVSTREENETVNYQLKMVIFAAALMVVVFSDASWVGVVMVGSSGSRAG